MSYPHVGHFPSGGLWYVLRQSAQIVCPLTQATKGRRSRCADTAWNKILQTGHVLCNSFRLPASTQLTSGDKNMPVHVPKSVAVNFCKIASYWRVCSCDYRLFSYINLPCTPVKNIFGRPQLWSASAGFIHLPKTADIQRPANFRMLWADSVEEYATVLHCNSLLLNRLERRLKTYF